MLNINFAGQLVLVLQIMKYSLCTVPFKNGGKMASWLSGKKAGVVNVFGNVLRYGNQKDLLPSNFSCTRNIASDT